MQSFTPKKYANRASRAQEPPPLDPARLNALALGYVARFATSAARLESYLLRKLKGAQRQRDGGSDDLGLDLPDLRQEVSDLVARFVAAGFVDDQAFARARSDGLQRRGFGRRHISQALGQAGIAAETVASALPGEAAGRLAVLALARKRRLGPFGALPLERAAREKQIAILLRAGHPLDSARKLVNAQTIEAVEAWASPEFE